MQAPTKRIGEIMVSMGCCTGRTMQRALRKQSKMREVKGYALRIGHILIEEGAVTEHELASALASQFQITLIDLIGRELLVGLLRTIPEPVLDKYLFIPVSQDKDGVLVAVDELLPKTVVDGLSREFAKPVRVAIAPGSQILKVHRWCRQHRRRLMSGQLEKVTLPFEYFTTDVGDPECTIKPGAMSVNSIKPMSLMAAGAGQSSPGSEGASRETEDSSPSAGGDSRSQRRARRQAERSSQAETGTSVAEPAAEPAAEDAEDAAVELAAELVAELGSDMIQAEPPPPPAAPAEPLELPPELVDLDEDTVSPPRTAESRTGSWTEVESSQLDRLPQLSRLLVARPANLVSILRELKNAACESLTIAPRGAGADVITADEDGSRVTGSLTADDYPEILDAGLELLDLHPGPDFTRPVAGGLQATIDGEILDYHLTAIPSVPATLVFTAADRQGWRTRRQVREWPLVEPLGRRLAQRRGLVLVTGEAADATSAVMAGLLSALRRTGLRAALIAGSAGSRVREVTTVVAPPERAADALAPESLLRISSSAVDVLALDLPVSPDQLRTAIPFASGDAALCVTLRERSSFDALGALVRAKLSPALISSVLDLVIAVYQVDRLCPSCRQETVLGEERVPAALKASKLAGSAVWESKGCELCQNTGVRGAVILHEVLTWDRTKATPDLLALDRKALAKRCFELALVQPIFVEARKLLLAGSISFRSYQKLLGLPVPA